MAADGWTVRLRISRHRGLGSDLGRPYPGMLNAPEVTQGQSRGLRHAVGVDISVDHCLCRQSR